MNAPVRIALAAFSLYFVVWSYMVSSALVAASALVPAPIECPNSTGRSISSALISPIRSDRKSVV